MRLLIKELEPTDGRDPRRRPRPRGDPAPARPVLPPQPRRGLPGLQAAAEPHGLRQRRLRAAGHGRHAPRDPREGAGHPAPDRPVAPSCTTTPTSSPAASSSASSVARAFVNHPPLLLADEPTGNLDPETSIGIMQLLYRINQHRHDGRGRHPRRRDGRQDAPPRDRARRRPDRARRAGRRLRGARDHARVRASGCAERDSG